MKQVLANKIFQWIRDNFVIKDIIVRKAWIDAVRLEAYILSLITNEDWEQIANVWHDRYKACLASAGKDNKADLLEPLTLLFSRLSSKGPYTISKKDNTPFSLGESMDLSNIMEKIEIYLRKVTNEIQNP